MLNPSQVAQLQSVKAPTGGMGTSSSSQQPMDDNAFKSWLGGGTTQQKPQGYNPVGMFASGVSDAAKSGINQIVQGYNQFKSSGGNPIPEIEGVMGSLAGVANTALAPISPALKPVGDAINAVSDKVSNVPAVQQFANSNAGQATSRIAQDVANTSTVAGTVAGFGGAPEIAEKLPNIEVPAKAPAIEAPVKPVDTQAPQIKAVADDWAKPVSENKATFNKAREAIAKAPETPKFLAEQKLNPYAHIEDGKYNTEEAAQSLRDTAGKMSSDTLRPSLQMADYTTPKTSVSDIVKNAISEAQSEKGVTVGDMNKVIKNIKAEGSALEKKYPNGMGLTDMHDEKITYAKNGGYNPYKSNADTNAAVSNRSLGSSMQKLVESKAPSDVSVKDFNSYLSKYYKAADYLDAIHGKTAPVSAGQALARGVAKFGGAALTRHLIPGGGELVSSFAGYQLGKAVEHALENLTNPMRDTFLRNLKITNPEAFTKVEDYLGKTQADAATRLRLPSGKPQGTPENPRIANPPKVESSFKAVPAKAVSIKNPKTGRFDKAFTSEPK